ncbi:MAG: hypothetical protein H7A23_07370 [Leptospiraceae bacterium]|nr:hypothetical protein [Leptospiraceae bacterium]MCP5494360.1 hypothetical protein [Leptospiraceae bacterium]
MNWFIYLIKFCLLLILVFFSSCQTIESFLSPIFITAGIENLELKFVTKNSDRFGVKKTDLTSNNKFDISKGEDVHAKDTSTTRGYYTIDSSISQISKTNPFLRYFAYSFTLDSPRIFRGTLKDYPSTGLMDSDPIKAYFLNISNNNVFYGRRINYTYEDTRLFATLYLGYFDSLKWYVGYGVDAGQIKYNFQLIENKVLVTDVVSKYRPLLGQTLLIGYNIGQFFPNSILENTFLYIKVVGSSFYRHPLTNSVQREDGLPTEPLYLHTNFIRLGIRKEIELISKKKN